MLHRYLHANVRMCVCVQEQYIFLHDAILESMTCGDTQIGASGLRFALRKYGKVDAETGLDVYQAQFNVRTDHTSGWVTD